MRTNIDIEDDLMAQAMKAGPFKTKKDAVEAGLRLLARQAAYREILKWRGKLQWQGDDQADWTRPAAGHALTVNEPDTPQPADRGRRRAGR
ncbi:MAG TPA: type II toxin-antitoxin system VapB family antitoxin [Rubrivivax sp.]|nr:type II toxin-antitoxin system VapB family antitoxin [Rubrivivax sp.]HPO19434.1 type II toxin-antitoxin system VapB family antitoxin [Rubrivivax sp.]